MILNYIKCCMSIQLHAQAEAHRNKQWPYNVNDLNHIEPIKTQTIVFVCVKRTNIH